jgi:hypothetical protein
MQTIRRFTFLALIAMMVFLTGCNKPNNLLLKHFSKAEIETIDKIITYYDQFVRSKSEANLSLDQAYKAYLANFKGSVSAGELSNYLPSKDNRIEFYQTLDSMHLAEFYTISDSVWVRTNRENGRQRIFSPYSFKLNLHGKYIAFLKEFCPSSTFFKDHYEHIEIAGDLSPSIYARIFHEYNQIDFNKKEERLVLIISLLRLL